jgi:hypothetical protein
MWSSHSSAPANPGAPGLMAQENNGGEMSEWNSEFENDGDHVQTEMTVRAYARPLFVLP